LIEIFFRKKSSRGENNGREEKNCQEICQETRFEERDAGLLQLLLNRSLSFAKKGLSCTAPKASFCRTPKKNNIFLF